MAFAFMSLQGALLRKGDEAIPKRQILNPKYQIPDNFKAPNTNAERCLGSGVLIFGFVWSLDFGIWSLVKGIATHLSGAYNGKKRGGGEKPRPFKSM
jgi:hypothetical protein